ncbi:MAG: RdgB/HAM1 family non-canonical purine NTP pyrophosphatase [Saprospiraceae bacterium]
MKIILATHNDHKVKEIQQIIKGTGVQLMSLKEIEWTEEIEENGDTLEENAWIKAETVWNKLGLPVIAEDTGLMVDFLNGAPGVHTARYAGDQKNGNDNMQKLLDQLGYSEKRTARFTTVMAMILDDQRHQFTGKCEGKIGYIKTGNKGFGYDPIFIPQGYGQSFGQLSAKTKQKISHRSLALDQLLRFLLKAQ